LTEAEALIEAGRKRGRNGARDACAIVLAYRNGRVLLMHGVRAAIPQTDPLTRAEFTTIRDRLIKIGARVIEHIARGLAPISPLPDRVIVSTASLMSLISCVFQLRRKPWRGNRARA
jgi:hypothetical protein